MPFVKADLNKEKEVLDNLMLDNCAKEAHEQFMEEYNSRKMTQEEKSLYDYTKQEGYTILDGSMKQLAMKLSERKDIKVTFLIVGKEGPMLIEPGLLTEYLGIGYRLESIIING